MNSSGNTSGYAFSTALVIHIPSFVFPIGLLYTISARYIMYITHIQKVTMAVFGWFLGKAGSMV